MANIDHYYGNEMRHMSFGTVLFLLSMCCITFLFIMNFSYLQRQIVPGASMSHPYALVLQLTFHRSHCPEMCKSDKHQHKNSWRTCWLRLYSFRYTFFNSLHTKIMNDTEYVLLKTFLGPNLFNNSVQLTDHFWFDLHQ